MNERQYRHRLKARKCFDCNVPLAKVSHFYGWTCPTCGRPAYEQVLQERETALAYRSKH